MTIYEAQIQAIRKYCSKRGKESELARLSGVAQTTINRHLSGELASMSHEIWMKIQPYVKAYLPPSKDIDIQMEPSEEYWAMLRYKAALDKLPVSQPSAIVNRLKKQGLPATISNVIKAKKELEDDYASHRWTDEDTESVSIEDAKNLPPSLLHRWIELYLAKFEAERKRRTTEESIIEKLRDLTESELVKVLGFVVELCDAHPRAAVKSPDKQEQTPYADPSTKDSDK